MTQRQRQHGITTKQQNSMTKEHVNQNKLTFHSGKCTLV